MEIALPTVFFLKTIPVTKNNHYSSELLYQKIKYQIILVN
jgi:hypothetical protein